MKSVLFIIPSLEIGGTVSSLNSIVNELRDEMQVSVLSLSTRGNASVVFKENLISPTLFMDYYKTDYRAFRGLEKLFALFVKFFKRLFGAPFQEYISKACMRKVERKQQFDVVVGFQEGEASLVASYSNARRTIAWVHCNYSYYRQEVKDELGMYSSFDNVVCVSQYTASSFCLSFPQFQNKVGFVYNLFDTNLILDRSKALPDDSRFDTSVYNIVSVGRIHSVKRYREIPLIAKSLLDSGKVFKWYIIGPISDREEYDVLVHRIMDLDLIDVVIPLGKKQNPYPFIKLADLMVCLSESEACPMIFIESKVLGTPIVTTDFGSAYEFISKPSDGIVVPFGELTQAISAFMSKSHMVIDSEPVSSFESLNLSSLESLRLLLN